MYSKNTRTVFSNSVYLFHIEMTVKQLFIINKQKSNEMHSDCLLHHLNPTYMFRPAPAIFRMVL